VGSENTTLSYRNLLDYKLQNWQVKYDPIPAPRAKARVRALNAKKKVNTKTSQLNPDFELVE
jgi:hypothetical protein